MHCPKVRELMFICVFLCIKVFYLYSAAQNTMLQIAQNLTIQMTFCDFNFFSNGHDTMKCEAANLLYPENVYISALCKGQVIFSQLWCGQPNYCKQMGKAPQDGNSG